MSTERRRIQGIVELSRQFPSLAASGLVASVGLLELDDCAVIPMADDLELVIGSDFVRGEDFYLFRAGLLTYEDIGYYLVGANVSDLAAMGAAPTGIVVVARYSPEMTDDDFLNVMKGVLKACADMSIPLLGGDSGGYPLSVLSAAAIGTCRRGRALLRSGGRAGDIVFASGDFGTAGAALIYFTKLPSEQRMLSPHEEVKLLDSWRRVRPALLQGRLLSEDGLASCGTDTSDGLKISCHQIAEASGLDIIVDALAVPISPLAREVARLAARDPMEVAFGDSVDFRLVFSAKPENVKTIRAKFADNSLPLYEIGHLQPTNGQPSAFVAMNGKLCEIPGVGWIQ